MKGVDRRDIGVYESVGGVQDVEATIQGYMFECSYSRRQAETEYVKMREMEEESFCD